MRISLLALLPISLSIAACGEAPRPTLSCDLFHQDGNSSTHIERTIRATLTDFSNEGVWNFEGAIVSGGDSESSAPITGYFFEYDQGKFDLVASTDRERITIMPDNEILKERGLQGVTMPVGGHVSTGIPLSASCRTSLPPVGNQRYEVPEKQ